MSEIRYREFVEGDKSSLLSLFSASFGKPREPAQWLWEYFEGPMKSIIVVAECDGRLVGHYAILPRMISHKGKSISAGLVVDVMTHPDYGRRGIFVDSALEAFRLAKQDGISTLEGFPNEAAIKGHRKVGWTEVGESSVLVRPIRSKALMRSAMSGVSIPTVAGRVLDVLLESLLRITPGVRSPKSEIAELTVEQTLNLGPNLENLITKSLPANAVSNRRDIEWLRWRLSEPSGAHHVFIVKMKDSEKILGLLILKIKQYKGMKAGAIFDVLVRGGDESVATLLIKEAIRKSRALECDVCLMLRSPAQKWKSATMSSFMLPTPKRLRFIIRAVDGRPLPEEYRDERRWHLQLIDHDVL
jgi:hypothetical protein